MFWYYIAEPVGATTGENTKPEDPVGATTGENIKPEDVPPAAGVGGFNSRKSISRTDKSRRNLRRKPTRGSSMIGDNRDSKDVDEKAKTDTGNVQSQVKTDDGCNVQDVNRVSTNMNENVQTVTQAVYTAKDSETPPKVENLPENGESQTGKTNDQGNINQHTVVMRQKPHLARSAALDDTPHEGLNRATVYEDCQTGLLDDYPHYLERSTIKRDSPDWGKMFNSAAGMLGGFLGKVAVTAATSAASMTSSAIEYVAQQWNEVDTWHECDSDVDEVDGEEDFQDAAEDLTVRYTIKYLIFLHSIEL